MSSRNPRTLLWRLGLALMVSLGVLLVLMSWYAHGRLRDLHHRQSLDKLERLTAVLAGSYAGLLDGDSEELRGLVRADGERSGTRITVIPQAEHVLADSVAAAETMEDHRHRPEVAAAFTTGSGAETRFSRTVGADMMYYARRVDRAGGPPVVVRAAMPLTEVDADLTDFLGTMGLAGALGLVLILAVVFLVSRQVSRPVRDLADGAARFASGDLSHRIQPPPVRELAVLSTALNRMAGELQTRILQLQTQGSEQQAILESMSNGVIALDPEQRVVEINRAAAQLLDVDAAASRGRLIQEVARQPELHQFVDRALSDPSGESGELNLHGETPRTVLAESATLTEPDGMPAGVLVVLNDVTQLRKLESMRSDFAANVSHELRTPITSIKGYVETLLEVGVDDGEQTDRFLRVIKTNSDRLAAIVEDVMALTKLEEPEFRETLERERVPLASVAEAVIGQLRPAAAAKRIELRHDIGPDVSAVIHAQMVEQALGNLVSNAIAYSPEGTAVTVSAAPGDGGRVELRVTDEGQGIDEEHLGRLFERFYRADKARSRALGGTGLGLAIVKHVAQVHGGDVGVTSQVGRGSTFRILLPAE
jgi:two-component system phosphate regulon sensor histidine kinase PhoR